MHPSTWRKSTHSGANEPNCVEVTALLQSIGVRDGKNVESGHLVISAVAFKQLLHRLKQS